MPKAGLLSPFGKRQRFEDSRRRRGGVDLADIDRIDIRAVCGKKAQYPSNGTIFKIC